MKRQHPFRWLLALLVVLSLVGAACGGGDDEGAAPDTGDEGELQEGGTVTFANDQEPSGWNINTASDNLLALGIMTQHVYPGAFSTNPEFEVSLNEEFLVSAEQTSDDPQTIEYVIRDDAVWYDMETQETTPITADDFVYYWEQIMNPENDVASTTGYEDIESVTGSGENNKTVTVVFKQPYAEWQALFDSLLPAHIMTELPGGWNDGLDGTNTPKFSGGPFMFQNYRPEQSVEMVPNPKYWGDNKPHLDKVIVRFGIDAAAVPAALENGEIDMAYPQPQLDLVQQVENIEGVEHQITIGLSFEHIDFDLENEFLKELAVRQAIAYALDEEALVNRTVKQFTDDAQPLYNRIFVNDQPQYEAHGQEYNGVDVDKARQTLEDAGFTEGSDGIYTKGGKKLTLRISTTGGNALRENTQEIIQNQMREAGIDIQIDNAEGAAVFDRFFPETPEGRNFDIAMFAWVSTPFASANKALYSTGSGSNEMLYSNPRVDELFNEVIRVTDQEEAAEIYNQIDEILWEDLPTIPLYAKPTFLPYRSNIANVQDNASTAGPLWNMYEWQLRG